MSKRIARILLDDILHCADKISEYTDRMSFGDFLQMKIRCCTKLETGRI